MATKSSTGHIRKRQYQPSITSYLHRDANPQSAERSQSPLSPPLPTETQATLLSVGMRVRKSVPEGYKTHKTIAKHGFPFPSTAPSVSKGSTGARHGGESTRELLPFCGLHKTGGWAAQEMPSSSAPAAMQTDDGDGDFDEYPGLTTSQSTILSTQASFVSTQPGAIASSKKRTYEEEIEDELDAYFDDADEDEVVINVSSQALRPIAKIKSSGRKAAMSGPVHLVAGDDFDEASFLVPDGMDVDNI